MRQKLLFAAGCLVCAVVGLRSVVVFAGSEFGSGELAGNQILAAPLFLLAVILIFRFATTTWILALVGSYFSLPLYLYLVFPRPFREVWPGKWAVLELPHETFVWNGWWITGIVATVLVTFWGAAQLIQRLRTRKFPRVEG